MRPLFFALDLEGGKFFFNTVREGDSVLFATEDEGDASNWVMAFYRATGQAHKPQPPTSTGKSSILASGNGKMCSLLNQTLDPHPLGPSALQSLLPSPQPITSASRPLRNYKYNVSRINDAEIDNHIADNDRARKHGMEEFIALDPVTADHHNMFNDLQMWSLDWRLKDPYASLVNQL